MTYWNKAFILISTVCSKKSFNSFLGRAFQWQGQHLLSIPNYPHETRCATLSYCSSCGAPSMLFGQMLQDLNPAVMMNNDLQWRWYAAWKSNCRSAALVHWWLKSYVWEVLLDLFKCIQCVNCSAYCTWCILPRRAAGGERKNVWRCSWGTYLACPGCSTPFWMVLDLDPSRQIVSILLHSRSSGERCQLWGWNQTLCNVIVYCDPSMLMVGDLVLTLNAEGVWLLSLLLEMRFS